MVYEFIILYNISLEMWLESDGGRKKINYGLMIVR